MDDTVDYFKNLKPVPSYVSAGRYSKINVYQDLKTKQYLLKKQIPCQAYNALEPMVHKLMENNEYFVRMFYHIYSPRGFVLYLEYQEDYLDLHITIKNYGPMDIDIVRIVIVKCIYALSCLHKHHIIHNDMKLENTLYCPLNNNVKLCDFGLSRIIGQRNLHDGTLEYFSPEKIKQHPYAEHFDWWCIGIMTFELLTGKHPFLAPDVKPTLNTLYSNINSVKNFSQEVEDEEACDFITRVLCFNKRNRLKTEMGLRDHNFIGTPVFK